jgi:hypothetical protein
MGFDCTQCGKREVWAYEAVPARTCTDCFVATVPPAAWRATIWASTTLTEGAKCITLDAVEGTAKHISMVNETADTFAGVALRQSHTHTHIDCNDTQ